MQFDDLLQRYFATTELSEISPDTLAAGIEHCRVDLGLERDPGKRFSLWAMLYMLDAAPLSRSPSKTKKIAKPRAISWT